MENPLRLWIGKTEKEKDAEMRAFSEIVEVILAEDKAKHTPDDVVNRWIGEFLEPAQNPEDSLTYAECAGQQKIGC